MHGRPACDDFALLVFSSSTAGEKAERSGSAYTAAKHRVIGLARAVAQALGGMW